MAYPLLSVIALTTIYIHKYRQNPHYFHIMNLSSYTEMVPRKNGPRVHVPMNICSWANEHMFVGQ